MPAESPKIGDGLHQPLLVYSRDWSDANHAIVKTLILRKGEKKYIMLTRSSLEHWRLGCSITKNCQYLSLAVLFFLPAQIFCSGLECLFKTSLKHVWNSQQAFSSSWLCCFTLDITFVISPMSFSSLSFMTCRITELRVLQSRTFGEVIRGRQFGQEYRVNRGFPIRLGWCGSNSDYYSQPLLFKVSG